MSIFQSYFILGFQHIADLAGYDHILFICALCAVFQPKKWKKVLILITAFTIGHSITLALSVTNIFAIESKYIEVLIPITIILTAATNFWNKENVLTWKNYGMTIFFGFIHGMGFSYLLKMLLGKESAIFMPLLAFNIGLEVGQIGIVGGFMLITFGLTYLGVKHSYWKMAVSAFTIVMAGFLLLERI